MKNLLLVVCLFQAFSSFAQLPAEQTNVTMFRNIPWGSHRDSIFVDGVKQDFVKDKSALSKNTYMIINDNMTIGNVRLNKINYIFNDDGRFTKVLFEGPKEDAEQMKFILDYKFGTFKNESKVDNISYKQWLVKDVTFTLGVYEFMKFEVKIESNWQASIAYKKNTSVDDF